MAISHTHPDHIGNVEMFPSTMLYVQRPNMNGLAPTTSRAPSSIL
jgi:glyoxylase-like metal-dependent hydrolase (beta-lactamase superfamily II)